MYSTLLLFFVVVVWHLSSDFILLFIEILTFKQTPHTSHSFKDDEEAVFHFRYFIDYFFFFFWLNFLILLKFGEKNEMGILFFFLIWLIHFLDRVFFLPFFLVSAEFSLLLVGFL